MPTLNANQHDCDHRVASDVSTGVVPEPEDTVSVDDGSERGLAPVDDRDDSGSLWLQAFREVLERDDLDEETDFFSAGGYSLLVPQLLAVYESLSGWRPPMRLIFDVSSPVELEQVSARHDRADTMPKYRYAADEAQKFTKHGIDLTVYGHDRDDTAVTVVHVEVSRGHFQEFCNVESTYIYCVVAGRGTFYLDGEAVPAHEGDLVVAPPRTRIYYFGTMRMVLTVSPAFDERNEQHIRFVDEAESPYFRARS